MARDYDHLMKTCKICNSKYNYKERGGKRSKTCSEKCSKANERLLRTKASKEWRSRKKRCE